MYTIQLTTRHHQIIAYRVEGYERALNHYWTLCQVTPASEYRCIRLKKEGVAIGERKYASKGQ